MTAARCLHHRWRSGLSASHVHVCIALDFARGTAHLFVARWPRVGLIAFLSEFVTCRRRAVQPPRLVHLQQVPHESACMKLVHVCWYALGMSGSPR